TGETRRNLPDSDPGLAAPPSYGPLKTRKVGVMRAEEPLMPSVPRLSVSSFDTYDVPGMELSASSVSYREFLSTYLLLLQFPFVCPYGVSSIHARSFLASTATRGHLTCSVVMSSS
ncbi:unnamed protein product, partial [Scytosiphon promiscuus]